MINRVKAIISICVLKTQNVTFSLQISWKIDIILIPPRSLFVPQYPFWSVSHTSCDRHNIWSDLSYFFCEWFVFEIFLTWDHFSTLKGSGKALKSTWKKEKNPDWYRQNDDDPIQKITSGLSFNLTNKNSKGDKKSAI